MQYTGIWQESLGLILSEKTVQHPTVLSLTAGSRQNEPATWVVCAGYVLVFCVFFKDKLLALNSQYLPTFKLFPATSKPVDNPVPESHFSN